MSPVEAYLSDLRAALGDRLPPDVREARLREARSHLLSSEADVGEAEAVKRYGRARAVANGLVRQERGYEGKSAWRLAFPLATGFLLTGMATMLLRIFLPEDAITLQHLELGRFILPVFALGFMVRVVQTRRWLAGPMAAVHAIGGLLVLLLSHSPRPYPAPPQPWTLEEFFLLAFYTAVLGAAWALVNALALGAGRLLDLRRVAQAKKTTDVPFA